MKRHLIFLLSLLFMGCSFSFNLEENAEGASEKTQDEVVNPLDYEEDKWTLLIYMAADNNLESAALDDLYEMESSCLNTQAVTVLILLDTSEETCLYKLNTGRELGSKQVISEKLDCVDLGLNQNTKNNLNLADKNVLEGFIKYAYKEFTAQNMGLIIWGHGKNKGFAYDVSSGKYMSLEHFSEALENGLSGKLLDFIGFDTCYGGEPEVMYECRNYASYGVGSTGSVLSTGWNYQYLFNYFQKSTGTITDLCNLVIQQFKIQYSFYKNSNISLFDLTKVRNLFKSYDEFLLSYDKTIITFWEGK